MGPMYFQAAVIGAGPAGLSCAAFLSRHGVRVCIIEKNNTVGHKVCAGGLTWNGLANRIPESLIERAFPVQHIKTPLQDISVSAPHPIIATVSRKKLGLFMLEEATASGAEFLPRLRVTAISDGTLTLQQKNGNRLLNVKYDYLIGADGSNSLVRRYLALPTSRVGIGLNYQVPGEHATMEWHLHARYFKNGYGWIFPHSTTFSIGAFADASSIKAHLLKDNLVRWAGKIGIDLTDRQCRAQYVNVDFRGWDFGHVFLAGDAAGLASALTGEGIHPAIVSGETIARKIIHPDGDCKQLTHLLKNHRRHGRLVHLTGKNTTMNVLLSELLVLALRTKVLNFHRLEMTG